MITQMYKILLGLFDLSNIGYMQDVILCGGVCISLLLDALMCFVIFSILVKIFTKRTIVYWFNKMI